jgi:FkbM family methyltransferase
LSYKRTLIRLLDRPGGRFLLGKMATHFFRRVTGDDLEIAYRYGLWTRRAGDYFFPDSPKFDYTYIDFDTWKNHAEQCISQTKDFWLYNYSPQPGDIVVDVGAGRGEDTLTFSRAVGARGRVIAIEAHPLSFATLKSFCRLNRLSNVTPLHFALMDKAGTVYTVESSSSWRENAVEYGGGSGRASVQAGTLDDLCAKVGIKDIAFLKLNIEGAERYALLGAKSTMERVRKICVACHDFRSDRGDGEQFRTRAFIEQFLIDHGFTLSSRPDDPRDYVRNHVYGLRDG